LTCVVVLKTLWHYRASVWSLRIHVKMATHLPIELTDVRAGGEERYSYHQVENVTFVVSWEVRCWVLNEDRTDRNCEVRGSLGLSRCRLKSPVIIFVRRVAAMERKEVNSPRKQEKGLGKEDEDGGRYWRRIPWTVVAWELGAGLEKIYDFFFEKIKNIDLIDYMD